jgi:hypothetical protein
MVLMGPPSGCGVGTRAPVAPSPAPPAGLAVLDIGRRWNADSHHMEGALACAGLLGRRLGITRDPLATAVPARRPPQAAMTCRAPAA